MTRPLLRLPPGNPYFNSHARVGRDDIHMALLVIIVYFNSHARVGRDTLQAQTYFQLSYFNSHARVGRDVLCFAFHPATHISTHTPAWGVTPKQSV